MSKKAITDRIESGFESRAAAERAVDAVFDAITAELQAGQTVTVRGFGTFKVKKRAERMGRNPHTGEPIKIAARSAIAFKSHVDI